MSLFPSALLNSPLFGIGITFIVYAICERIVARMGWKILSPFVLAWPILLFIVLYTPGVTYKHYDNGGRFIAFLLGPATIALAVPLYKNVENIKKAAFLICIGVISGALSAIVSIYFLGRYLGATDQIIMSMLPKSVTNPIALEIANAIGGIQPITAACVIIAGVTGAIINHKLLAICGFKHPMAIGLGIGASSHALGTSTCVDKHPLMLASSSVSIALTGIATSIFIPILLPILKAVM